jgi:hypothetical protein
MFKLTALAGVTGKAANSSIAIIKTAAVLYIKVFVLVFVFMFLLFLLLPDEIDVVRLHQGEFMLGDIYHNSVTTNWLYVLSNLVQ